MSLFGGPVVSSPTDATAPANPDVEVVDPPADSISSLSFSPQAEYLAVGSWDNTVRIYEVGQNRQTHGRAVYAHQGPVLGVCWSKDGTKVFSGGVDNVGMMLDFTTGQSTKIAQHDAPIKGIKWIDSPQGSLLVTGSWDKTLRYWDLRAPNPAATLQLPERCYSLDVNYPLMVVGMAERHIQIYNLTNPTTVYKSLLSPFHQMRVVTCWSSPQGFGLGGIEGRVAMQFVDPRRADDNYSFKCHRKDASPTQKDQSVVFSVNDISFHPIYGTFSTCGSDGTISFWDKDARMRIKTFDPVPGPIAATCFSHTGAIFAYAVSYNWWKGHVGMTQGHPNKVMLHFCRDEEVKRKQRPR